jgi:hypothetical protein
MQKCNHSKQASKQASNQSSKQANHAFIATHITNPLEQISLSTSMPFITHYVHVLHLMASYGGNRYYTNNKTTHQHAFITHTILYMYYTSWPVMEAINNIPLI